jgi:hypothetical protein
MADPARQPTKPAADNTAEIGYAAPRRFRRVTRAAKICWVLAGFFLLVGVSSMFYSATMVVEGLSDHTLTLEAGLVWYWNLDATRGATARVFPIQDWREEWWLGIGRRPSCEKISFSGHTITEVVVPLWTPVVVFAFAGFMFIRWWRPRRA